MLNAGTARTACSRLSDKARLWSCSRTAATPALTVELSQISPFGLGLSLSS